MKPRLSHDRCTLKGIQGRFGIILSYQDLIAISTGDRTLFDDTSRADSKVNGAGAANRILTLTDGVSTQLMTRQQYLAAWAAFISQ